MPDKRRWLPRWQRIELVQMCVVQGMTRREAAAWRGMSLSTVQYWIDRYPVRAMELGMSHATVSL